MEVGDYFYYIRAFSKLDLFEIVEFVVSTVNDTYFVGVATQGSKNRMIFTEKDVGTVIFTSRADALNQLNLLKGD